jgi:hypothetical protein
MPIDGCTCAGFPTLNGLMISKNRMKVTRNKGKREQAEQVGKRDKGIVELRNDLRVSLSDKLMAVAT